MAGFSRRFTEAGYTVPKYMLEAKGRTLFNHVVGGFRRYFDTQRFMFVIRKDSDTENFINRECQALGLRDYTIVTLDAPTRGQAETVAIALMKVDVDKTESLTVFNIDTIRPDFTFPTVFDINAVDGYLEVFRGEGDNWSYVEASSEKPFAVYRTTEKQPISDLCCTGLYHFKTAKIFSEAFTEMAFAYIANEGQKELYVAPMYNLLIRENFDIRYNLISKSNVIFCGVPKEYEDYISLPKGLRKLSTT